MRSVEVLFLHLFSFMCVCVYTHDVGVCVTHLWDFFLFLSCSVFLSVFVLVFFVCWIVLVDDGARFLSYQGVAPTPRQPWYSERS